jgi:hypothetical protein
MGIETVGRGQVVAEAGEGGRGRQACPEDDGRVGKGWNSNGGRGGACGVREAIDPG